MNVAYVIGQLPAFREVIPLLRDRLQWEPAYWITYRENDELVKAAYPRTVCHQYENLNRGRTAPGLEHLITGPLGAPELRAAAPYLSTAADILDRIDYGGIYTHRERQRFVRRLFAYWLRVIDHFDIERAVFHIPPHWAGEYLLYAACKTRGVPTFIFRPGLAGTLNVVCDVVDALPARLERAYERRLASQDLMLSKTALEAVGATASANSDYRPAYVEHVDRLQQRSQKLVDRLENALVDGVIAPRPYVPGETITLPNSRGQSKPVRRPKEGDDEIIELVCKLPGRRLKDSRITKWEYKAYRHWGLIEKFGLKQEYEQLIQPVTFTEPFVYFAMHYQPERTSAPDAQGFIDHYLAVALVASQLPMGWKLLVKEHPSQFKFHRTGEMSRWLGYYQDLAEIPNVVLIDTGLSTIDLIDAAHAVATLTGTAGWEALVRGKPAICFGGAWYAMCRGAYRVETETDVQRAFADISRGVVPSRKEVLAYVGALEDIGRFVVNNANMEGMLETPDRLSLDLAELVVEFEQDRETTSAS